MQALGCVLSDKQMKQAGGNGKGVPWAETGGGSSQPWPQPRDPCFLIPLRHIPASRMTVAAKHTSLFA